jgi:hypothetical protein
MKRNFEGRMCRLPQEEHRKSDHPRQRSLNVDRNADSVAPRGWFSGLRDGQSSSERVECRIDTGGQSAHTCGAGEGDQCNEQSILDQILTFIALEVHKRDPGLAGEVVYRQHGFRLREPGLIRYSPLGTERRRTGH